jgi:uncharacterized membrane protein YdcZ (DUF606 family)
MWIIGSILGAILIAVINIFSKLQGFTFTYFCIISFLSVSCTYCFWFAWRHSPLSFLSLWFVQSAMTSLAAFVANKFMIKQPISWFQVIGIIMILVGTGLLKK